MVKLRKIKSYVSLLRSDGGKVQNQVNTNEA